jgi:NAD(P)-dependent dehydrogenase (short-subunit alcohol dehydrogenase family)
VLDSWGGVDMLICCAAVGVYGPIADYSLADWEATFRTNVSGVFLTARALLPSMRERGGGRIIAIGSGAGKQGYANLGAYSASKFALLGFMESLAAEVGADGIKVATINPGSILTGFAGGDVAAKRRQIHDGRKYLEPEDVAGAICYLLEQSDRAWTQEMNLWPF